MTESSHNRLPKIAFYGSSLVSAYWNGAATYYRGMLKYLARLGYEITFYEPDAFQRQQHRDMKEDPDYARDIVYSPTPEGLEEVLSRGSEADIVIKASGVGIFDEQLESAVLEQARTRQIVAFWDVDAPATLDRLEKDPDDPFHDCVPRYDRIFTYGGGAPVVRAYERFGAQHVLPIYNAVDPETHHPVDPDDRYAADLAFCGNRLPDREERVMEFFVNPARKLTDKRFLLAGSGWDQNFDRPPNIRLHGHLGTEEHNRFNCTPRAVLNISRESMARYGFSPATRVFEVAGAAGCLITDAWEGLEQFLVPGKECLAAESGEEVAEILADLTADDAARIGQAGHERILKEHTYFHRAQQFHQHITPLLEERRQASGVAT